MTNFTFKISLSEYIYIYVLLYTLSYSYLLLQGKSNQYAANARTTLTNTDYKLKLGKSYTHYQKTENVSNLLGIQLISLLIF